MSRRWVVLGLAMLVVVACGDDAANTTTATAAVTTTTPPAPTSTAGTPTTTAVPITVPITPITITTLPIIPITITPITLPPLVMFEPDGIGFASFRDDPATVIATAQALFGPPDDDTGLLPSDAAFCPGTQYRKVFWIVPDAGPNGLLMLLFSDDDAWSVGGAVVFSGYGYLSPEAVPLTAGPPVSIDVGITVAEVFGLWPEVQVFESEFDGEEMFQYSPGGYSAGIVLMGRVSGLTNSDLVIDVYGGRTCYGDAPGLD